MAQNEDEPIRQYKFGRYVIDRAFPVERVAIELNGGAGGGYGRPITCHNCGAVVRAKNADGTIGKELRVPYPSHSGRGAERDAKKINTLQLAGWQVLIFTSQQLNDDPAACIEQILILLNKARARSSAKITSQPLTKREYEVLFWLCQGFNYDQIAYKLGIKRPSVKRHGEHLRAKFGAKNQAHACAIGVAMGIVDPELLEQQDKPTLQ